MAPARDPRPVPGCDHSDPRVQSSRPVRRLIVNDDPGQEYAHRIGRVLHDLKQPDAHRSRRRVSSHRRRGPAPYDECRSEVRCVSVSAPRRRPGRRRTFATSFAKFLGMASRMTAAELRARQPMTCPFRRPGVLPQYTGAEIGHAPHLNVLKRSGNLTVLDPSVLPLTRGGKVRGIAGDPDPKLPEQSG